MKRTARSTPGFDLCRKSQDSSGQPAPKRGAGSQPDSLNNYESQVCFRKDAGTICDFSFMIKIQSLSERKKSGHRHSGHAVAGYKTGAGFDRNADCRQCAAAFEPCGTNRARVYSTKASRGNCCRKSKRQSVRKKAKTKNWIIIQLFCASANVERFLQGKHLNCLMAIIKLFCPGGHILNA